MFNDEKLNDLIKEHEQNLKNNIKMLDELSEDIKTMQKVLKNYAVPNQRMEIQQTNEALLWDGESINWEDGEEIKPLMQTKKEVRIQLKPKLPIFFKQCLKTLGA